jgi:hypothetical protein
VDLLQGVIESFVAVPGSPLRGMRERLTGTGSTRGIDTTSAGFVWFLFPDSYFLIFGFLFSLSGKFCRKCIVVQGKAVRQL